MARLQDMALGRTDVYNLDPMLIQEEPGWNIRTESPELAAHIRQLADSIKEVGVQEPVTVYLKNDIPILTNGHCRLMACRLAISEGAEIKSIPARAEARYANDADRVLSMLTRNSGKPLLPLEQAEVVKRLMALGWDKLAICMKSGFSGTHFDNLMNLSAAPEEVKDMVRGGQVAARTATDVIRKEGAEEGTKTLQKAVETAKEAGKTKATAKHLPKPPEKPLLKAVPKASAGISYENWGPRMKKLLEKIRDVENIAELQSIQAQVGPFLKGMTDKPGGV